VVVPFAAAKLPHALIIRLSPGFGQLDDSVRERVVYVTVWLM
jgi:hypothetical protein